MLSASSTLIQRSEEWQWLNNCKIMRWLIDNHIWLINEDDVARQLIVKTISFRILFTLRIDDLNANHSTFKSRDIYNMKAQLRRDDLESLTFIQTLMRELNRNDWKFSFQKNNHNQISHFFFFKKFSHNILRFSFEVLVLDCIYKTNKYKMSLLIIFDQIALHRNFYVTFFFMIKEKIDDYFWALNQLKLLYRQLKFSYSIVFVTDMKKDLMSVRYLIFSQFNHLLCIWHINNNVLINCKKKFFSKETWEKFFSKWKEMMYAFSNREFREMWDRFSNKYNLSHEDCIKYLTETYIEHYRRRFVKCYIDEILHFETTMIFRSEDEHAQLKRHLESSIENLKIVIDNIKLLLINQIHDHAIALDDAKLRYSAHLRKSIFQQLFAFVALNVINLMMSQYKLLTNQTTALSRCIDVFTRIMRLSCSHKMQKRLYEKESLLIEDVHSHWR
jgi:hypothetical protein